ncbi:rhodanese-like domain-containing protein [Leifsonia poae]|uniref:Sulfurtransferase n=1 Tax=Leifsonia poae TaxID=110933 RepID=A0A9W6H9N2_9MICO|nr:rhodanese-like domain-containing protein [Leifsonia poae]GLJ76475.1 sulfurtransferase [Leifsonia poae]
MPNTPLEDTATAVAAEPELITPGEGAARVEAGALLIDVRSQATRDRVGALTGAVVVDRERLPELFGKDSPERLIQLASTDQEIVVVCGSVDGSRPVAEWLGANGFGQVAHVEGGFPAWREAGLPTGAGTEAPAEPSA